MIHEWEWMIFDDRDFLGDELLDIIEICLLFSITERYRSSLCTCSTSTTDAVDVCLRNIRNLIVDHVFELIDIDPTSCNICRDEDTRRLSFEVCECFLTSWLSLVSMDCLSWYTILSENLHDFIRSTFCPSEYEYCLYALLFEDIEEEWGFVFFIDKIYLLCNNINSRRNRSDRDFCRIYKDTARKLDDLWRHSRWEEKCLFLRRKCCKKFFHIMDKSHIEHSICLIEDKYFYVSKCEVSLGHEVEEATWCSNDDIDSITKRRDLCSLSDSSEYDAWSEMCMSTVCKETLTDLDSEFTSRCDDERTDSLSYLIFPIRSDFWCDLLRKSLDDRYRKSCSLSSTCLCTTKKIESTKDDRNCFFLYGSRSCISFFFESSEYWLDELEFGKLHWFENKWEIELLRP